MVLKIIITSLIVSIISTILSKLSIRISIISIRIHGSAPLNKQDILGMQSWACQPYNIYSISPYPTTPLNRNKGSKVRFEPLLRGPKNNYCLLNP